MPSLLDLVLKNFESDINTVNAVTAMVTIAYFMIIFMLGTAIHLHFFHVESKLSPAGQYVVAAFAGLVFCSYFSGYGLPGLAGESGDVPQFIAKTGLTAIAGVASQEIFAKLYALIVNFPLNIPNPFRSSN
jgi:hypothetical protein